MCTRMSQVLQVIRKLCSGNYLSSGNISDGASSGTIAHDCHTDQKMGHSTSGKKKSTEAVCRKLEQYLEPFLEEGIIEYMDCPDYIDPEYNYERPLSVFWEVTYACNQDCPHCTSKARTFDPRELTQEEIDEAIDQLIELEVGLISITGGEPLLKKDTVLQIAQRTSEHGIELELLTNGMFITPEAAEVIYCAGIRDAQVSLDCAQPDVHDRQRGFEGAWKETVEGIHNLRKAGIHVMASAVMNSETLEYFDETKRFLQTIADTFKIEAVKPAGQELNNMLSPDLYYKLLELRNMREGQLSEFIFFKERCSIGTTPVITPTGDVYPCIFTKYEELRLGNVRKTSLGDIYEYSDTLSELLECTVDKIKSCRDCWNRYYCGGGCRGCAFEHYKTIYSPDPYQCEARKKFARKLLRHGHPLTKKALRELVMLAKN
ncbi:MAG: radical SAM protein [Theionarchaea archaeon]|nr:radical SAM protein [Theionarchaea archaeon]